METTTFDKSGLPRVVRYFRYLFRFVRADDKLLTSIKDHYLWFANPLDFNDPFDCRGVLEADNSPEEVFRYLSLLGDTGNRAQRKARSREMAKDKHALLRMVNEAYLKSLSDLRMCCFSESNDETLMWSHYADSHRGVCLVFDFLRVASSVHGTPIKVSYVERPPKYNFIREFVDGNLSPAAVHRFDRIVLGTKTLDWQYEREVRLAGRGQNKRRFDPNALVGIIFGARLDQKARDLLITEGRNLNSAITFHDEVIDLSGSRVIVDGFKNSLCEQEVGFIDGGRFGLQGHAVL